jgi:hypothetical protein
MPIISPHPNEDGFDGRQSEMAMTIRRGVIKGLKESDLVFLPELTLSTGRRADLIALDRKGGIIIFEIKSSIADFQVDTKWHEYKAFCDRFYFVTHPSVPMEIFPETEGFVFADEYGCEIIREAQEDKLNAATRKALTLRFARNAAMRTKRLTLQEQFLEDGQNEE